MPPDDNYKVGYKKPPQHSRFKPGRSGNRPARTKQADKFASLFSDVLDETVTVTESGRRRKISKRELLVKQVVDQAARGEPKAFPRFFRLMAEIDREGQSGVRGLVNVTERPDGTVLVSESESPLAPSCWCSEYASMEDYQRRKPPLKRWYSEPSD